MRAVFVFRAGLSEGWLDGAGRRGGKGSARRLGGVPLLDTRRLWSGSGWVLEILKKRRDEKRKDRGCLVKRRKGRSWVKWLVRCMAGIGHVLDAGTECRCRCRCRARVIADVCQHQQQQRVIMDNLPCTRRRWNWFCGRWVRFWIFSSYLELFIGGSVGYYWSGSWMGREWCLVRRYEWPLRDLRNCNVKMSCRLPLEKQNT